MLMRWQKCLWAGVLLMLTAQALAAEGSRIANGELAITLISERVALVPGGSQRLGLLIEHQPHWHTYWQNAGDSGIPTKLRWNLPDGIAAGEIQWPHPQRFDLAGIINFGYGDRILLPVPLEVSAALSPPSSPLTVTVDWLVCKEECIPGRAELSMSLPVATAAAADTQWAADFAAADARIPVAADWRANVRIDGELAQVEVELPADFPADAPVDLYPVEVEVLSNATPADRAVHAGVLHWPAARSDYLQDVPETLDLVVVSGEPPNSRAWQLRAQVLDLTAAPTAEVAALPAADTGSPAPGMSIATALLFALLGGAILNLMPCVFPVLTLKALALRGDVSHLRHGLLYAAGSVLAFLALAAALLALRAAGESLGWGFQLQSPWLIGALVYLFFAMGLSLSGVFTFGERLMGVGQSLTEGEGDRAAFFTGVLAAVVASPCTAPFMGAAMGFALTQSAALALLIFGTLGFGLALPFLLLCLIPGLAERLPRPGAWMDRLKQILAFPLYLSAVWLLWVYGEQLGPLAMAQLAVGAVFLAFALWLLGWSAPLRPLRAVAAALSLLAVGYALHAGASQDPAPAQLAAGDHEPWSEARLAELRGSGKPVLVNMTAAWCITCLANERVALSTEAVRGRMQELGMAYLKGDWTRRDDSITRYLAQYGRTGVPLYVLYPADGGAPRVLPQLLTPELVLAEFDAVAAPL
ncbi:MAG: protein-disulfide reductase DsbD family protein [Lysobacterales bacterium]